MSEEESEIDSELMRAGFMVACFHVEAGSRSYVDYSARMIEDLGEKIRPYLRVFYESLRHYPGFDTEGMTEPAEIGIYEIEEEDDPDYAPRAIMIFHAQYILGYPDDKGKDLEYMVLVEEDDGRWRRGIGKDISRYNVINPDFFQAIKRDPED